MEGKHKFIMENCNKTQITGVLDVISFDLNKVILETECGMLVMKGNDLHVSRLSVEKGEVDVDGHVDMIEYSEVSSFAKKGESMLARLFK